MRIQGPLRVYVRGKGEVAVAADIEGFGACHFEVTVDGELMWVRHLEGSKIDPVPMEKFTEFLLNRAHDL